MNGNQNVFNFPAGYKLMSSQMAVEPKFDENGKFVCRQFSIHLTGVIDCPEHLLPEAADQPLLTKAKAA